jgi:hypothetical protein
MINKEDFNQVGGEKIIMMVHGTLSLGVNED